MFDGLQADAVAAAVVDNDDGRAVAKLVIGTFWVHVRPADGGLLLPWLKPKWVKLWKVGSR